MGLINFWVGRLRIFRVWYPEKRIPLLGSSWDLVSTVVSTLNLVISNYKYSYLIYNPSY